VLRRREQLEEGSVAHAVRSRCARLTNVNADPLVGAVEHRVAAHILSAQIGNQTIAGQIGRSKARKQKESKKTNNSASHQRPNVFLSRK